MVKIPSDDAVELPLPILASFDCGPSQVNRRVSVQPLLAEHREEGGEERNAEACEQNGLDVDYRTRRAGPLWERRDITAECCIVHRMNKDAEEGGGLFVGVRLKLGVDLGDERRRDGGEQTSLWSESAKCT